MSDSQWTFFKIKIDGAEPERSSFFFSFQWLFLPCQNLPPTLPTVQLDCWQFKRRFGCVMLAAANVASSRNEGAPYRLTSNSPPSDLFFHFQSNWWSQVMSLESSQVTSPEAIHQILCSSHGATEEFIWFFSHFTPQDLQTDIDVLIINIWHHYINFYCYYYYY